MFLERIATREPITIDVDDDDDGGDDDAGGGDDDGGGNDCDESGGKGCDAGKIGDEVPSIHAVGSEEEAIETVEMEDEDGYCLIDRQPPQPPSPSPSRQPPSSPTKG